MLKRITLGIGAFIFGVALSTFALASADPPLVYNATTGQWMSMPAGGYVPVGAGGTGGTSASGTLLDNITGFSGTGFMSGTGAGTYTFTGAVGGTGVNGVASSLGLTSQALYLSGTYTGSGSNPYAYINAVDTGSSSGNGLVGLSVNETLRAPEAARETGRRSHRPRANRRDTWIGHRVLHWGLYRRDLRVWRRRHEHGRAGRLLSASAAWRPWIQTPLM